MAAVVNNAGSSGEIATGDRCRWQLTFFEAGRRWQKLTGVICIHSAVATPGILQQSVPQHFRASWIISSLAWCLKQSISFLVCFLCSSTASEGGVGRAPSPKNTDNNNNMMMIIILIICYCFLCSSSSEGGVGRARSRKRGLSVGINLRPTPSPSHHRPPWRGGGTCWQLGLGQTQR